MKKIIFVLLLLSSIANAKGLGLNVNTGWISVPNFAFFDSNCAFSCNFRVSSSTDTSTILSKVTSSSNYFYFCVYEGANLRLRDYNGSDVVNYVIAWSPAANTDYRIAWVRNGSNFYIYTGTGTYPMTQLATFSDADAWTTRTTVFEVGNMSQSATYLFNGGSITNVRFWNYSPTLQELNTQTLTTDASNPNYDCVLSANDGTGTAIKDTSGNGKTGTATGTTIWIDYWPPVSLEK